MIYKAILFLAALLSAKNVSSLEYVGFSKDPKNGDYVFLEYKPFKRTISKQNYFEYEDRIPGGFRLVRIDGECIRIEHLESLQQECFSIRSKLKPNKYSFVARDIEARFLIQQVAHSMELTVLFDEDSALQKLEKVELYNLSKEEVLTEIISTLKKSEIYARMEGNIYVFSAKENLGKLLEVDELFSEMVKDIRLESSATINLLESVSLGVFTDSIHRITGVQVSSDITKKSGVNIFSNVTTDSKDSLKLLHLAARLTGHQITKADDTYIIK